MAQDERDQKSAAYARRRGAAARSRSQLTKHDSPEEPYVCSIIEASERIVERRGATMADERSGPPAVAAGRSKRLCAGAGDGELHPAS